MILWNNKNKFVLDNTAITKQWNFKVKKQILKKKNLLQNKPLEDENTKTSDQGETLKTVVTPHSKTRKEKSDDNSTEDSKKVGSKVDKKELTTFMTEFMERYMRPTSKIVLVDSSASDLTPSTAALEANQKYKENVRKDMTHSYKV